MSNNTVTLIGRLGKKPECRTLNDGARLAILNIATDDGYKARDGAWVDRTTWHRVTIWGDKRVDYIEKKYEKGDLVHFTGRLDYSRNERGETTYVNAELTGNVSLLAAAVHDEKPEAPTKTKGASRKQNPAPRETFDDVIPF